MKVSVKVEVQVKSELESDSGKWKAKNGNWKVENETWKVESEKRKAESEKWKMKNEKWKKFIEVKCPRMPSREESYAFFADCARALHLRRSQCPYKKSWFASLVLGPEICPESTHRERQRVLLRGWLGGCLWSI